MRAQEHDLVALDVAGLLLLGYVRQRIAEDLAALPFAAADETAPADEDSVVSYDTLLGGTGRVRQWLGAVQAVMIGRPCVIASRCPSILPRASIVVAALCCCPVDRSASAAPGIARHGLPGPSIV